MYNPIDNLFFDVSYDAFFQVNNFINNKLFEIIKENVSGENILDLYSGVGTLSIMASQNASIVYAIEVNENAVKNALLNAKTEKHGRNIRCLAIRHIREQMRLRQSYLRMDLFKQVSQCIMISCPTNQEFIDMYQEEQWEDMLLL